MKLMYINIKGYIRSLLFINDILEKSYKPLKTIVYFNYINIYKEIREYPLISYIYILYPYYNKLTKDY
jgi:hypothetical protein